MVPRVDNGSDRRWLRRCAPAITSGGRGFFFRDIVSPVCRRAAVRNVAETAHVCA